MKINKLNIHQINFDEFAKQTQEILEKNRQYYRGIRIRCAAFKNNDKFYNALCIIKSFPKDYKIDKRENNYYDNLHLIEEWISIEELPKFIEQFKSETIKLTNAEVITAKITDYDFDFLHRGNDYCSLSGYHYTVNYNVPKISKPDEFLLSHKLPFYPDVNTAITEWSDIKRYNISSNNSIQFFFPECRAYFDDIQYMPQNKLLKIKVKNNDTKLKLYIKGGYTYEGKYKTIDSPLDSGDTSFLKIPDEIIINPEKYEIYLIDKDDNIYDFHKETVYWLLGLHRAFEVSVETELEKQILKAIDSAENETTEFKPFIKKGDNKIREIIEAVIAFANTRGGHIFIGINKHAIPEGIDEGIREENKINHDKKFEDIVQEYIGYLKKEISDNLCKTISIKYNTCEFKGKRILIVEVPEGNQKPYFNFQTKEIFIRKGANNVKPDPDKDLPKIMPKDSNPLGGSFGQFGGINY